MNIVKTSREISRRVGIIENRLSKNFLTFYKTKIIPYSIYPVDFSRKKYENDIKAMIRVAVQESYLHGNVVVADAVTDVAPSFQTFISTTDINNISQLTNKLNERFWRTTARLLTRKQEVEAFSVEDRDNSILDIKRKEMFNVQAAYLAAGGQVAWNSFNSAIVAKLTQITDLSAVMGRIPQLTIAGAPQPGFETNVAFDFFRIEEQPIDIEPKVMFLTAEDAKVDPDICEPLNRLVFDIVRDALVIDETFGELEDVGEFGSQVPEPPLHDHCRCRLIPIIAEKDAISEFQNDLIEAELAAGTLP